nr:ribonuclease H-like domain-containing protein [Tanacetum cinerariifolium]
MDLESAQNNAVAKLLLLKQENGNSFNPVHRITANADGTSISTISGPVTAEEKAQKKNDVKARSMLLMALPNENLLTSSQYKDAKTLFEAIQARFGGNEATKKTQKTLLKQMYENFNALSTKSLDSIFNRLAASTPVSTVSSLNNTANLSDAAVYAFFANQPNGSQLVHEDLEQIYKDDLKEIDLKWQLALLSMRARRYFQRTDKKITINGSDTAGYDKTKDLIRATWVMMRFQLTWLLWISQTQRYKIAKHVLTLVLKVLKVSPANADGTSTLTISGPVTAEEKAQKKNDVKARSMLLMALPNKHLLTFSQYKDDKTLFEAIQARFGGNDAIKKTQKTLLKQITNEVDTASIQVSDASTPVSTVSSPDNTANLSDATVYAFLENQPNGSQLVHEDLEQIHEDDLEEMNLKWQLALMSKRARRSPRNQESRPRNQDSSRKTVIVEDTSSKAMVVIDEAGFD